MFETIITHNDFDGVASATLCAFAFDIDKIIFTGPSSITRSEISITSKDIVFDLPYPLECALWFDHHQGNLDELKYRNIDYNAIDGLFLPEPSCARVIYKYLNQKDIELPIYFDQLLDEADIIDSSGIGEPIVRHYVVTSDFAADEVINVSTGAGSGTGAATPSGDTITSVGSDAAEFNNTNSTRARIEGLGQLSKGVNVTWDSSTSFHFSVPLSVGDRFSLEKAPE